MTTNPTLSKRVIASLTARSDAQQWEELIANLLRRLELDDAERSNAERDYEKLADNIASKLSIPRHDVEIFPQGSMRTQTTISQRHPVKFDLDERPRLVHRLDLDTSGVLVLGRNVLATALLAEAFRSKAARKTSA